VDLVLVDGTFELFRCYFGAPKATAPDGTEVGATRALLRSLLSLAEDPSTGWIGVAFDRVIESFRNDLFPGYKTGDGIEPDLLAQFPLAEAASRALGLVTWPMVAYEADDALATAVVRYGPVARRTILCSPDKDLAQCVRDGTVLLRDRIRKTDLDKDGVRAKFGVDPASIPDWLALVGDTADGIPGLPRWGARSAAAVLARWRSVDRIPDDEAAWQVDVRGAAALAEILRSRRPEAMLYRTLATLRTDVPLAETADDLVWQGADRDLLPALCRRIDAVALLDRVPRWRP
jgi:5'-3' exonuclease